ncbi:hypothetical protein ACFL2Q_16080, partial [Thermodesulfobacteriota bacterium]
MLNLLMVGYHSVIYVSVRSFLKCAKGLHPTRPHEDWVWHTVYEDGKARHGIRTHQVIQIGELKCAARIGPVSFHDAWADPR